MAKRSKRSSQDIFLRKFVLSMLGLAVGYFLLNEVSTWEKLPLGQVPYIVVGGVLIAVSGIVLLFAMKTKYTRKKRNGRSRHVFLKDLKHKKGEE